MAFIEFLERRVEKDVPISRSEDGVMVSLSTCDNSDGTLGCRGTVEVGQKALLMEWGKLVQEHRDGLLAVLFYVD